MASEAMQARFKEEMERGSKLAPRPKKERARTAHNSTLKPGKRIKPESEDRKTLKKRWAFIKHIMILTQRRTNGHTACMECGAVNPRTLELDHIIPAGEGGPWTPDNAQLLCAGPGSCHARKHGEPEWSKSA